MEPEDGRPLYWLGNAAKTRVVAEILAALPPAGDVLVVDYGCGSGGDWPTILRDTERVRLVAFEPDGAAAAAARGRLGGFGKRARVLSSGFPPDLDGAADFVVSFSVFEHVLDRRRYLLEAKRLLSPDGTFYLNYDDGHFRVALEADRPRDWWPALRAYAHNRLAPLQRTLGRAGRYQAPVERPAIESLLADVGFACARSFYSNLTDFKEMFQTIRDERSRREFCRLWLDVEARLNESFAAPVTPLRGDPVNLWRWMPSRTLVLAQASAAPGRPGGAGT